jgi:hypothetical protein
LKQVSSYNQIQYYRKREGLEVRGKQKKKRLLGLSATDRIKSRNAPEFVATRFKVDDYKGRPDGVYMTSIEKTLTKVTAAVLYSLQARHPVFNKADVPELERFVLQVYSSAPAHIKLALGGLSFYINILGLLFFLKPLASLSLKQVSSLICIMDASSFGAVRAYSRFFFNIVTLGALSENQYVS